MRIFFSEYQAGCMIHRDFSANFNGHLTSIYISTGPCGLALSTALPNTEYQAESAGIFNLRAHEFT
jgi:hypothetical protein